MQANIAKQNKYLNPGTLSTHKTSMQANGDTQDKYAIEVHAGTPKQICHPKNLLARKTNMQVQGNRQN